MESALGELQIREYFKFTQVESWSPRALHCEQTLGEKLVHRKINEKRLFQNVYEMDFKSIYRVENASLGLKRRGLIENG